MASVTDLFGPPIATYTRAQALQDGVLVDMTRKVQELELRSPFKVHLACTPKVWAWIAPTPAEIRLGQSVRGRLHDTLIMMIFAARQEREEVTVIYLRGGKHHHVHMRARNHPGDEGEHVITLTLADED